ncbi:MAG: hypothetical protein ACK2T2_12585 [Anaerolineales bacterium]|jgi:hypothetical protein
MPGERVSRASRKLDVVLVAARYRPQTAELDFAQGYVRTGPIWSDLKLIRRDELIEKVSQGKKVAAGKPVDLPGDFELLARVELVGQNGSQALRAENSSGPGDDLGLPLV